jgi:hypothetical protein
MSDDAGNRWQTDSPQDASTDLSNQDRPDAAASSQPPRERLQQAADQQRSEADEPEEAIWQGTFSSRAMIGNWILAGAVTVILPIIIVMPGSATGTRGGDTWCCRSECGCGSPCNWHSAR